MAVTAQAPKTRELKTPVASPAPAAPPAQAAAPIYAPDGWALWFWLGGAGVLILLHVLDWLNALFAK
jgi:hypothetical protein